MAHAVPARRLALVALGALCASPAAAQRFGQWWWEARVTGIFHDARRSIDGERISDVEQQEVKLSLDMNGFVVHPAIGDFRLGLDLYSSRIEGGSGLDTERLGVRTDLSLFPRGRYPIRFFFHRQDSDHAVGDGGRSSFPGLLETSTRWGARARLRRGPLRGTLLGLEHSTLDPLAPETDRAAARSYGHDRQFVDWSRRGDRLRHHARLEHSSRSFGLADLEIDDLALTLDQQGQLTPAWRWELSGAGVRRVFTADAGTGSRTDDFRLRSRLAHSLRGDDLLDLRSTLALTRVGSGAAAESYDLAVFYRWRGRPGLEVAPFAQYQSRSASGVGVDSPRAGLATSWNRRGETLDTLLSATASYGSARRDGSPASGVEKQSSLAFAFSGSLTHGTAESLRKELEVEVGRNEIRLSRDPLLELPDLGLPARPVGTEDSYRARVSLHRRWRSLSLNVWSDWSRRQSAGSVALADFESETLSSHLQVGFRRFSIQTSGGETRVAQTDPGAQEIRYLSARASWRPWRSLSLEAVYRTDTRRLAEVSDVEGERLEAQLDLRLGLLSLKARFFDRSERAGDGRELASRGLTLALSRRLAGWLPIVTGTQRRGVIR